MQKTRRVEYGTGKYRVWKMRKEENAECGKWGCLKMNSVGNAECAK